jgi:hypothetical protein
VSAGPGWASATGLGVRALPGSVFPPLVRRRRWNAHDDQAFAVGRVITEIVERFLDRLQMPGGVGYRPVALILVLGFGAGGVDDRIGDTPAKPLPLVRRFADQKAQGIHQAGQRRYHRGLRVVLVWRIGLDVVFEGMRDVGAVGEPVPLPPELADVSLEVPVLAQQPHVDDEQLRLVFE